MLQTFCYLCIKKPLTLPHTPLRLLKHRTKNTYEPPKERTRRTNHKKNDQKHEPKERPKARTEERTTKRTTKKHEPKARTTKRTTKSTNRRTNHGKNDQKARTQRTNHEKNDQKNEPRRTNHEKNDRKARVQKHKPSPDVSSPPHSPGIFRPASQSHKAQQAPLIASLRPKRNPPLIVAMCRRLRPQA